MILPVRCWFCGQLPVIVEVTDCYWNAQHHFCNGEPGVSICNSVSADQSVRAWNKWNYQMSLKFPRVIQLELFSYDKSSKLEDGSGLSTISS